MTVESAIVALLPAVAGDGWHLALSRAPAGLAITAAFAVGARILRSVTISGALAGAFVTFLLWIASPPLFIVELTVFLLTAVATRAGYRRKQQLGTAEKGNGRRASQVLANLAVASAAALLATYLQHGVLLFACVAALAEAASDTVSSEMGQALGSEPVLITSFRPVPVGTDGGVSGPGTLAGIAAALVVSGVAVLMHIVPGYGFAIVAIAAVCGMIFDSLLGATLERARALCNDQVNFSSTFFSAALAVLLARLWL